MHFKTFFSECDSRKWLYSKNFAIQNYLRQNSCTQYYTLPTHPFHYIKFLEFLEKLFYRIKITFCARLKNFKIFLKTPKFHEKCGYDDVQAECLIIES